MAIAYEYGICGLRVLPVEGTLQDVVYEIDWYVDARDGDFFTRYANSTTVGDPDPNNFIPFSQLTEADLKAWLPDPMTEDMLRVLGDAIWRQQVAAQAEARALPWEQTGP